MSVPILIWLADRVTGISPTTRAVMEYYCNKARDEHLEAWPFAKDIAKAIGRSLRTVKYARQEAMSAGLLRYVTGGYFRGDPARYEVMADEKALAQIVKHAQKVGKAVPEIEAKLAKLRAAKAANGEANGKQLLPKKPVRSVQPIAPITAGSVQLAARPKNTLTKKISTYPSAQAHAEGEGGIEGQAGQSVPSPEATEPASAVLTGRRKGFALPGVEQSEPTLATQETAPAPVAGNEMVVAESTEPSPSAPELHDQSAEAGASTNPLPATELTRSTEADSEAPKPPPDPITERLKDLESAMRQIRLLIPDAENEDRLVYEAQYAEETARLRAALALQTPITGTVLVLQQSQVRSATASVLVEGALGFPAPITQADQGIAATAALGPKTGGNWWDQHQLNTDQRGVA